MKNLFQHLHNEHEIVATLFEEILNTKEGEVRLREELFEELQENIISHARAEEDIFYERLKKEDELKDMVDDAIQDHFEVDELLMKISEMEPTESEWMEHIKLLQTNIEAHVQREEDEIFPRAEKIISENEAASLLTEFEIIEEQYKSA